METPSSQDCLFCKIVRGEIPCHKVYEDETHIAFLDIFPPSFDEQVTMKGMSIVIPKLHFPPYAFAMPDNAYSALLLASKKVALAIDRALPNIQTCMIMEGMEIPHVHIKLFPIYEGQYPGYLSSQKGSNNAATRASDTDLAEIAEKIQKPL
jgi:diadenosine tetraphosphate (Ap4A) HIT family hydrolase